MKKYNVYIRLKTCFEISFLSFMYCRKCAVKQQLPSRKSILFISFVALYTFYLSYVWYCNKMWCIPFCAQNIIYCNIESKYAKNNNLCNLLMIHILFDHSSFFFFFLAYIIIILWCSVSDERLWCMRKWSNRCTCNYFAGIYI